MCAVSHRLVKPSGTGFLTVPTWLVGSSQRQMCRLVELRQYLAIRFTERLAVNGVREFDQFERRLHDDATVESFWSRMQVD